MLRRIITALYLIFFGAASGFASDSVDRFWQDASLLKEPSPALAGSLVFYNDRGVFETANPDLPVEDFNEGRVLSYNVEVCSDPFDSTTADDCWSPGDILLGVSLGSSSGGNMMLAGYQAFGQSSKCIGPWFFADYGYLNFPGGVTAVGFDLLTDRSPEMVDIRIFGSEGLIASTAAQADIPGPFFGVWSEELITSIEYHAASGSAELLDNLAFGMSPQVFTDGFESGDVSAWTGGVP